MRALKTLTCIGISVALLMIATALHDLGQFLTGNGLFEYSFIAHFASGLILVALNQVCLIAVKEVYK